MLLKQAHYSTIYKQTYALLVVACFGNYKSSGEIRLYGTNIIQFHFYSRRKRCKNIFNVYLHDKIRNKELRNIGFSEKN